MIFEKLDLLESRLIDAGVREFRQGKHFRGFLFEIRLTDTQFCNPSVEEVKVPLAILYGVSDP